MWEGRWREDEIRDGSVVRILKREIIGTLEQFPTKRLAQRELETRVAHINSTSYRPVAVVKFSEFSDRWKALVLPQYKQSTQREYRNELNGRLVPDLGHLTLREFSTERLQEYVSTLKASPKTVRNLVATLRAMWRTAKAWGYASHQPFDGLALPRVEKPEPRSYSLAEITKTLEAAPGPLKTFLWIMAETGMRPGETCGLDWKHINTETRVITVRQSVWRGRIQPPKTKAALRTFAISPELALHLTAQRKVEGLLFQYRNGRPWREEKVLEKKVKPLLTTLQIANRGLHAFRHSNATLLDQLRVPVKVRQERLGHCTATMTLDGYTETVAEDDRRAAAELGRVLCPSVTKNNQSLEQKKPETSTIQ